MLEKSTLCIGLLLLWMRLSTSSELTSVSPGFNSFLNTKRNSQSVIREPRYFIVASKMVRAGELYRVVVTIFEREEIKVRASLLRNGVEMGSDAKICQPNVPHTLIIKVPRTSTVGDYRLRVEGNQKGLQWANSFVNETQLVFSEHSIIILIQTDKPIYMQGQTVRFRVIPMDPALKAFDDAVDVFMIDPRGNIVRRWLSIQSFGVISLNYILSEEPIYGKYSIRVEALNQTEEQSFLVEEYYQPRFEVNVTMPAMFIFDKNNYISGTVDAKLTSGAPVVGTLILTATIKPIESYRQSVSVYKPLLQPVITNFQGYYEFSYGMREIEKSVGQLNEDIEVTVTAEVGHYLWNETVQGYSKARVYSSRLSLQFLGGSPQVFKPSMPFTCYLTISYYDGFSLTIDQLLSSNLEIQSEIMTHDDGEKIRLETRNVSMIPDSLGIWKVTFDLKQQLGANVGSKVPQQLIKKVQYLRVAAFFKTERGESAEAELLAVSHYSGRNRDIRVTSSTGAPKVGEYIVFHVRGNFYMEQFTFLIMSKGVILLSGIERMEASRRTFAISVSPQMAPTATIIVYHLSKQNQVVADSLTYPVNGIYRNNFTVQINNKKDTGNDNLAEIMIRGQPGAYVGLSGIDSAFYSIEAGNEISYAQILEKMEHFEEHSNGKFTHKWISREGLPNQVKTFPAHSAAIDVARTFEYCGLVVFTDIVLPRRVEFCDEKEGQYPCLTGYQCYRIEQKCDGFRDCFDGTDESNCGWFNVNETDLIDFKLHRFNRVQAHYENVWLWEDVIIGADGHFTLSVPVPEKRALWMISAFGVTANAGLGLLTSPTIYSGVRPLTLKVEMPRTCRQGEQLGIRVTIFNYKMKDMEVLVVLANSPAYILINVGSHGNVSSYYPTAGEHQHRVTIKAEDSVQLQLPIVPTVLGDVEVNIRIFDAAQSAKDEVTRIIRVKMEGAAQYRHTSVLIDLTSRAYVLQYMHTNLTESPVIPYDLDRYYVHNSNVAEISVVGDVVGPVFSTMPVNALPSLLSKPMESAEQTMFSFAANLYTLTYLRLTNQKNKGIYRDAFHNLNIAYQRQLSFQNEDGSFSYFRSDWNNSKPSVWVTAYCIRVLSEATSNEWENFLFIDPNVIAKGISWLLQFQTEEGSFYEISPYANRKLNDTSNRGEKLSSTNVTLTAHVLIALHYVKNLPEAIGARIALASEKSMKYLETKVDQVGFGGNAYKISVLTYALMLNKSPKADAAFFVLAELARFEDGFAYWGREKVPLPDFKLDNNKPFLLPRLPHLYDSENIEATAYALLVYVARQEAVLVHSIVKWLNSQRLHDGGWASTQDTAAAMRALIEYSIQSNIRNVTDLTVSIEAVAIPDTVTTFRVNANQLGTLQKLSIPNAYGTVKVEARGTGYAILQMRVQYGVDRDRFITEPPGKAFSLITYRKFGGRNASLIEYHSCQSWTRLEESERSGMAVLEVNIPTGYFILQSKLDEYVLSNIVPTLRSAKYFLDKVVFYFDYLEMNETCVNFRLERVYPVANMTRYLSARVYEYYAPERFNETILFEALDLFKLDICQVCGSYQCPNCPPV